MKNIINNSITTLYITNNVEIIITTMKFSQILSIF